MPGLNFSDSMRSFANSSRDNTFCGLQIGGNASSTIDGGENADSLSSSTVGDGGGATLSTGL